MSQLVPSLAVLGMTEMIVILGLLVLLFGAKKIPQLMKGFGDGVRELKRASKDSTDARPTPPRF